MRVRELRRGAIVADIALGIVLAVGLAVTAIAISTSWGGLSWVFGCLVGAAVGTLALLRRRNLILSSTTGLLTALAAVVIAWAAGLPREPGPTTALALAVLVGSAVRRCPVGQAAVVASGGLGVTVTGFVLSALSSSGVSTVAAWSAVLWLAALAIGLCLRLLDALRRVNVEAVRREERVALAHELHDVVTHHVTGIVVQAQAAQIIARRGPTDAKKLGGSLNEIAAAGSDALTAMRRLVGLLRDGNAGATALPAPEPLGVLVERFERQGPKVRLEIPPDDVSMSWPPEVSSSVYRIVREALTNVSRHGLRQRWSRSASRKARWTARCPSRAHVCRIRRRTRTRSRSRSLTAARQRRPGNAPCVAVMAWWACVNASRPLVARSMPARAPVSAGRYGPRFRLRGRTGDDDSRAARRRPGDGS